MIKSKAAKGMIKVGEVSEGLLNTVEMAFRPYDPCHACATHALPGNTPLVVSIYDSRGQRIREIRRDG